MSSMTHVNGQRLSHLDSDDKPERSRNAKAQARHRAKRKAYIEQLESTVTKLQTALGTTSPCCPCRIIDQCAIRLQSRSSRGSTTTPRKNTRTRARECATPSRERRHKTYDGGRPPGQGTNYVRHWTAHC